MCETCLFFLVLWLQMESEQLLSLSGSALAQAVSSLLETPGLYVFSDILELPNVKEVSTPTPHVLALHREICDTTGRTTQTRTRCKLSISRPVAEFKSTVSISVFNLFLNSDDPLWSRPCTKWNPTKLFFKRKSGKQESARNVVFK